MRWATATNGLDVPEHVLDATGEYVSPERAAQDTVEAQEIRRVLREVDPLLDVIFVKPGSKAFPKSPRWYFVRHRESGPDAFWVIEDEQGNYSKPTMRHVERLREFDTHSGRDVWAQFEKARVERKARADKAMEEKGREFREKLLERLDHNHGVQAFISGKDKEKLG